MITTPVRRKRQTKLYNFYIGFKNFWLIKETIYTVVAYVVIFFFFYTRKKKKKREMKTAKNSVITKRPDQHTAYQ